MIELNVDLRDSANQIADILLETSISDGRCATWLGPTIRSASGEDQAIQRTGDATLYDGSAGIALACSSVAGVLRRDDLMDLAVRSVRHAISSCERVGGTGLYDGIGGIGLAALVVGARSTDGSLRDCGLRLLARVGAAEASGNDLISGRAGTALAFLRAATLTGDEQWFELANRAGRALVERADRRPWGWCWPEGNEDPGLCGLAHGSAGPAWVLQELAGADHAGNAFDEAIAGARQYERSWFNAAKSNWPDLRPGVSTPAAAPPHPTYWCHGSVGIGLSRLAMQRLRPHPGLVAEAAAALQSACAAAVDELSAGKVPHGLTICHGIAGTIELLLEAHLVLGDDEHLEMARWFARQAIELLGPEVEAWPGGVQDHPGPGLMSGLAGAMCVLTRTTAPESLGSVALLAL